MTQPESRLSSKILKELRSRGAFCFKIHGSELTMAGLPDLCICWQGRHFALETKMPAKRSNTSQRQEYVMEQIRQAGGVAQVVCSVAEAVSIVFGTDE